MGAYSTAVIADGASYYWRLGEASGTTAAAAVGGAPGTISGGVTLGVPGPLADGSTAMTFDGTTGQVLTAANVSLVPPFTLETWLRGTWSADSGLVSNTAGGTGLGDFLMLAVRNNGVGRCYTEPNSGTIRDVTGSAVINDNVWHHLAGVFLSAQSNIYCDGLQVGAAVIGGTSVGSTTKPISIGTSVKYSQAFGGALAEVAIYPTALTPAQIAAHYALRTATGAAATGRPISLGMWQQVLP